MQMTYTPKAWAHERDGWKAVIQLNLVRTVLALVDALTIVLATPPSNPSTPPTHSSPLPLGSSPPSPTSDDAHLAPPVLTHDRRTALLKLKLRLAPLRQVEADLKTRLGAGTDEVGAADDADMMATPFDDATYARQARSKGSFRGDVVVRSHRAWKERARELALGSTSSRPMSPDAERDCTSEVLAGCAEDMCALWEDDAVREVVRERRVLSALGDSAE